MRLQVRIPDDRTSRSNFGLIDDELEEQLRDILEDGQEEEEGENGDYAYYEKEENETSAPPPPPPSSVFQQARNLYHSCMDTDTIEEIGLDPLVEKLRAMGGWPVVEGDDWKEDEFDWLVLNLGL